MINIEDYPILKNHRTKLKKTSKDDNSKDNSSFMTESELEVINFDKVAKEYAREYKIIGLPTSNDALFINLDGEDIFIEFKNGKITPKTQYNVAQKIYDSILMLTDILDKNIRYTREHMSYILVYNAEKNSKGDIAEHFTKKGGNYFIKFNLERFKGYCFKDVYTYTKEEFSVHFVDKYRHLLGK